MDSFIEKQKITGVVLSGGLARRMGGQEKALIPLKGQPMIQYILDRLQPQVGKIVINSNRHIEQYKKFNLPIISDQFGHFDGPLAGIYSALLLSDSPYILTVPCDSPFISKDLVARLYDSLITHNATLAVAHDGERLQPVFALINTQLQQSLKHYLDRGERKLDRWYRENNAEVVDFSDTKEMFININNPDELLAIEERL